MNEQITANETLIESNLEAIRVMQQRILAVRADCRALRAENSRLRRQRAIFETAAFKLRQVGQP